MIAFIIKFPINLSYYLLGIYEREKYCLMKEKQIYISFWSHVLVNYCSLRKNKYNVSDSRIIKKLCDLIEIQLIFNQIIFNKIFTIDLMLN